MSDDKTTISAAQDDYFLTLINHAISRATDSETPNDAIAILVSLGELCPKMALAIKMMSPLTKRQSDIFDFLRSIEEYTKLAESGSQDPLRLMSTLRTSAIVARDKFVSSPSVR